MRRIQNVEESGGQMLQRVSADNVTNGENGFVGGFENFGERVEGERDAEVSCSRIARWKKRDEQQHH